MSEADFRRVRGSGLSPYNPKSQPDAPVHAVGRESVQQARGNLLRFGTPWNHRRVELSPDEIAERNQRIKEAQAQTYGTKIGILQHAAQFVRPNEVPEDKELSSTAKSVLGEAVATGMLASPDHWSFEAWKEELEKDDPQGLPAHLQAKLDKARETGNLEKIITVRREIAMELVAMDKNVVTEAGVNPDPEFWAKIKPVDIDAIDYEEEG